MTSVCTISAILSSCSYIHQSSISAKFRAKPVIISNLCKLFVCWYLVISFTLLHLQFSMHFVSTIHSKLKSVILIYKSNYRWLKTEDIMKNLRVNCEFVTFILCCDIKIIDDNEKFLAWSQSYCEDQLSSVRTLELIS